MVTAARMQRSFERGALDASLTVPRVGNSGGDEVAAHAFAIDEVMRAVEREESWPRFISAWYLLDEQDPDDLLRLPQVREHVLQGENAAWMHTFALLLLARVAADTSLVARPSTELAVTLAVEAARDAAAHWATALELLAEEDDAARSLASTAH